MLMDELPGAGRRRKVPPSRFKTHARLAPANAPRIRGNEIECWGPGVRTLEPKLGPRVRSREFGDGPTVEPLRTACRPSRSGQS